MANQHMKKRSTSFITRDCISKLKQAITSHQCEWPPSKNLQTINAGECVEKREPSCQLLVGMRTDRVTMENSMEIPLKIRKKLPYDPAIPLLLSVQFSRSVVSHSL